MENGLQMSQVVLCAVLTFHIWHTEVKPESDCLKNLSFCAMHKKHMGCPIELEANLQNFLNNEDVHRGQRIWFS